MKNKEELALPFLLRLKAGKKLTKGAQEIRHPFPLTQKHPLC